MALIIGWLMNWSAKRSDPERPAGFLWGMVHGALMPAALPALIMGRDVTIYAPHNVGRMYKIGYAGGVNVCGFIFFGILFLDLSGKRRKKEEPAPDFSKSDSDTLRTPSPDLP